MGTKIIRFNMLMSIGAACLAQTTVDLRTQTKNVDFSNAAATRPVKTGTSLPAVCSTGELYFKTNSPAGANLYGCVATNTWQPQAGGGGGGSITTQLDGVNIGSRSVFSINSGFGVINTAFDSGTAIVVQHNVDTAAIETRVNQQIAGSTLCQSASGSATAYTCAMSPSLTSYTIGMVVRWRPDITASGAAATLNIDSVGSVAIKNFDLSTPLAADILTGQLYDLWYDGANFRLRTPPASVVQLSAPVCSSTTRGRFWLQSSSAGVKDQFSVCAKDSGDAYAWRVLY